MRLFLIKSIVLSLFYLVAHANDSFEKVIDSNCSNAESIRSEINFLVSFSDHGLVDSYFNETKKLVENGCRFKKEKEKKNFIREFEKRSKRFLNKGRRAKFNYKLKSLDSYSKNNRGKCSLSINDINVVKKFSSDYGFNLPANLTPDKLELMYQKDVEKIKKNINKCFSDYLWHLSCADHAAISFSTLVKYSKNRSIEKETEKVFELLDKDCVDPKEKDIILVLKKYMEEPVYDSMRVEYMRQEKLLEAVAGKQDHRPILKEMERISNKLNEPDLIERQAFLYQRMRIPGQEAYKAYQSKRVDQCTNIDNTNSFIKLNQSQANTESCYAFGAANLLNYHLGIFGISPIYLVALSISETDAFWYPIEKSYRALLRKGNSISQYNGGFSGSVIEKAIERGKYCSNKDVIDVVDGSIEMDKIIKKTESVGVSGRELLKSFKNGHMLKEEYEKRNEELFMIVKKFFPKATQGEFQDSIKNSSNGPGFFLDFLFSQCKTPLPLGAKNLKVESSYAFTELNSISIDKLDQLIESQNIAAIGIQSDMLFKGDVVGSWSPHIVTLTGRRWNKKKNQCEFRIINSWGKACELISNPEIDCDFEKNELWISELLLLQFGNSLTTIIDSPMIRAKKDPNFEEFDPDL